MLRDLSKYTITRHVCPRNCYDACGMLAYTSNGILKHVAGDPKHGYTNGKLCAKGYAYVNRVYSEDRLKYPMYQSKRGLGNWQVITWEKAIDIIAEKMLELNSRYGSNLSLALNKYSGNFGLLHLAAEGLFNSLGPTTQALGSPCWSAGLDATYYDFGRYTTSDPNQLAKAKLIILWGVNPAWTAVHSIPYIFQAQAAGAKVVVIDPIYTTTAKKADLYLQLTPGSDGALALALGKLIVSDKLQDEYFLRNHTSGWQQYLDYLNALDLDELVSYCGQSLATIQELASLIGKGSPVFNWIGFGMQRHVNGGQNIRAINALAALTGNIGRAGGGVHYAQQDTWSFNFDILCRSNSFPEKENRLVDINNFASVLSSFTDPPVKMLWVSCRNPLTQDPQSQLMLELINKLELVVTVDQFLTPTAQKSNLVLPTTTHFEELDVVSSYWHHWIGINQQAIKPYWEAKSDLEICQLISQRLNQLCPQSCSFPSQGTAADFLDKEFSPSLYEALKISHWTELIEGPRRVNIPEVAWSDLDFDTPSGKFEFYSTRAKDKGLPPICSLTKTSGSPSPSYPFWLLTTHSQFGLNSQFQNLSWLLSINSQPLVLINPKTAEALGITNGMMVRVYNHLGQVVVAAKLAHEVAPDTLVCYQGWFPNRSFNINQLVTGLATDMGETITGSKGVAFYSTFVNLEKLSC